jgi:hypothetical protein
LVSFRFNDVFILVGSIYNPDRLHFDKVRAFLDLLALMSLDFDHLIVLKDFNFDILLDPEHSATRKVSWHFLPPVGTKATSYTCIDHVLTKFPQVVSFGTHCILTFSYCNRPPPRLLWIVLFLIKTLFAWMLIF